MIISASRRTEIPAFYGDWFIKRIEEGFFLSVNPNKAKMVKEYSLQPCDVDAIVFWTKNPKPFIKHIKFLDKKGYNYYFQFTLNNYNKTFEPNLPPFDDRLNTFMSLSKQIGADRIIWRYDPIIISSITSPDFIINSIKYIAGKLKGYTKRLIISFIDFYAKINTRIEKIREREGITFTDIVAQENREALYVMCRAIKQICVDSNIEVFTCAEMIDLHDLGIEHGSCIDGELIRKIFNIKKEFSMDHGQRKECRCATSVDVGVYNTCNFQCIYCYANGNTDLLKKNLARHYKDSPVMINNY